MKRLIVLMLPVLLFAAVFPAAAESNPVTLTCLINHAWYPTPGFSGIIPDEITRQTGVRLDVTIAKDSRQINMLLASGDLPDLIYTSSQFDTLSNAEVCYSYDELIERYGIDWEIDDDLRYNAMRFSRDDKLYTVINHYTRTEDWHDTASVPMTASLMIREDMLAAMGVPPPKTLDELSAVYLRVREEYPDVVPLTFNLDHRFNIFRVYFGLGLAPFIEQPYGVYKYFARDPRYADMLRYLNRLYQNGCLLLDNFAATRTQDGALYKKGLSFSHSWCTQNANMGLELAIKAIDPAYHSVELAPLDGAAFSDANLGWSGTFITRKNRDPEASIRFIAWMFTPEAQRLTQWGREGIDYRLNDDGLPVFSPALHETLANNTYDAVYNPWFYFGASAIVESEGRCALLDIADYEKPYTAIRNLYDNRPWIIAAMPQEGTREKDIYDRATAVATISETKIIISETDEAFEANLRDYTDALEALDIEALEGYVTRNVPLIQPAYAMNGEKP